MELQLIENKDGSRQTRIKVSIKEWNTDPWLRKNLTQLAKFEKESSRYKYFIADGDLLNRNKKEKVQQ